MLIFHAGLCRSMKPSSVLGIVLLVLILSAMFAGLYFAYGVVGKAVENAEAQQIIVPCDAENPCESGECIDGYCRKVENNST